jgi:hypothetical protein
MEKLVKNHARLAALLITGALVTLGALTSGGCGSGSTTADIDSPELKQRLNNKYPELVNPPVVKVKKKGSR